MAFTDTPAGRNALRRTGARNTVMLFYDSSTTNLSLLASASGQFWDEVWINLTHGGIPVQDRSIFCVGQINGFFQFYLTGCRLPELLLISKFFELLLRILLTTSCSQKKDTSQGQEREKSLNEFSSLHSPPPPTFLFPYGERE